MGDGELNQNLVQKINPNLDGKNLIWKMMSEKQTKHYQTKQELNFLKKHDIILVGDTKLYVSDTFSLNLADNYSTEDKIANTSNNDQINHTFITDDECNESHICRICYSTQSSEENPLINICNCTGSVKYVHYLCLSKWIESKISTYEQNNLKLILCERYHCEICQKRFPVRFTYKNSLFKLIDYDMETNKNSIVLESVDYIENCYQIIYILNVPGNTAESFTIVNYFLWLGNR